MHVVVCIVGFRNPDDVAGCLAALAHSTHSEFEVVICENGGADARAAVADVVGTRLASGQAVEVLPYDRNSGYAGGNDRCVTARRGADAWWILNPDTRVAPRAMALLVEMLADGAPAGGGADAVGGTLLREDGRVQAYGGRWRPLFGRAVSIGNGDAFDTADAVARTGSIDYILGAALMFTPRFLDRAGPMRDDYFLYGEEVEWGLRARARGLRLAAEPRAVIHHAQGTTTGDGGSFAARPRLPVYLDQRNKILILRDTTPAILIPGAIGCLIALVVRAIRHRAWRQLGYGLSGWVAGVRNRRGAPAWAIG